MKELIEFLNKLESNNIYYKIDKTNDEFIMVEVVVPGERWEVEFSSKDIRIEKFKSDGILYDKTEIENLFLCFSDRHFLPCTLAGLTC